MRHLLFVSFSKGWTWKKTSESSCLSITKWHSSFVSHRCKLRAKMSAMNTTISQKADLKKCNQLQHHIAVWQELQNLYMPGIQHFCIAASSIAATTPEHPKNETLYLPSSLPPSLCHSMCLYNYLRRSWDSGLDKLMMHWMQYTNSCI